MVQVLVLGLDGTEPTLLERWIGEGALPVLGRLCAQGAYGRLKNLPYFKAEPVWTTVMTGAWPEQTGYWGRIHYDPSGPDAREFNPDLGEKGTYSFRGYPPFHALGPGRSSLIFDVPQSDALPGVSGLQVFAYGAQSPRRGSGSLPEELFEELVARHGAHPTFEKDTVAPYHHEALETLRRDMHVGVARRTAAFIDLMGRGDFDLAFTVYAEPHAVGHCFWHLAAAHPLSKSLNDNGHDEQLALHQSVDRSIGEIIGQAGPDTHIVIFSPYGMQANASDLCSTLFLPEMLYRWAFPGRRAIAPAAAAGDVPAPCLDYALHWKREVWSLVSPDGRRHLESPESQAAAGDMLDWQPANWFKPCWPKMRAFALPSYSDGYLRINLAGRERGGIVAPDDYDATCGELEEMLLGWRNARTGQPIVASVRRTRDDPFDVGPKTPPPDLIVDWSAGGVTDAVEAEDYGRIGPVPYFRTGGHTTDGFLLVSGPGIAREASFDFGEVIDIAPTVLGLLGMPQPGRMLGRDLVSALPSTLRHAAMR